MQTLSFENDIWTFVTQAGEEEEGGCMGMMPGMMMMQNMMQGCGLDHNSL